MIRRHHYMHELELALTYNFDLVREVAACGHSDLLQPGQMEVERARISLQLVGRKPLNIYMVRLALYVQRGLRSMQLAW